MLKEKVRRNPKKKPDYPEQTEGARIAAETRTRCNTLSEEQRREHFEKGMAMIRKSAPLTVFPPVLSGHV
jgi:hypothetical protein